MNVLLYGPPGVGKSTIVRQMHGVDLEDYDKSVRTRVLYSLLSCYSGLVIGTTDVPVNYPIDTTYNIKVLLWLNQKEYEDRRKKRDLLQPSKGLQQRHEIKKWLVNFPGVYVEANDPTCITSIVQMVVSRSPDTLPVELKMLLKRFHQLISLTQVKDLQRVND